MVTLSIVLPAYNEQRAIGASLLRLASFLDNAPAGRPWQEAEVVVVDDGSSDATVEEARAASARRPARVVALPRHRGKGAAVREGLLQARGDLIVVTDVDLSYGLQDVEQAAAALASGVDMVIGDRRHPSSRLDLSLSALGHVARRQIVSALFNAAVRAVYGIRWKDTQCGLKGFRREAAARVAPRVRTEGFLADIEMLLAAESLGLEVAAIPVHLTYLSGESAVRVAGHAPGVALDALRIRWAQLRGRYGGSGGR
ncbi:MAG TPA: glycosyltransferase [Candidatus Polarisedimenticolia bacterium]|nr:glycosyltransferase [Candidatus Polarisedimenticolia bacterium]